MITQKLTKEELVRVHLLAPDELSSYIEGITTFVFEKTDFAYGHKVRVRYYRTNPADQERRKKALSKIMQRMYSDREWPLCVIHECSGAVLCGMQLAVQQLARRNSISDQPEQGSSLAGSVVPTATATVLSSYTEAV